MGYGLKYYSEIFQREGDSIQLRVHQRDYAGAAKQIGEFAGMWLEIQGATDALDAAIVKTSLRFSMADTVDMADTATVKHGGWTEFYTPDATLYKVELLVNGSAIWTGYVTPDSWSESLKYRDHITVTARDNLGHLEDFEFAAQDIIDAGYSVTNGLVSIGNLIQAALAKIEFPMSFSFANTVNAFVMRDTKAQAAQFNWYVDVEALAGKSWWEALTGVLESTCFCLRYVGGNKFAPSSLRGLPYMGRTSMPAPSPLQFINRTGYRTLDPAYKQIIETFNFDAKEGHSYDWQLADFTQTPPRRYNGANGWEIRSSSPDASPVVLTQDALDEINAPGDITGQVSKYVMLRCYRDSSGTEDPVERGGGIIARQRFAPATAVNFSFAIAHLYDLLFHFDDMSLPDGTLKYGIYWDTDNGHRFALGSAGAWSEVGLNDWTLIEVELRDTDSHTVSWSISTPNDPGRLVLFIDNYYPDATLNVARYVRLGAITLVADRAYIPSYQRVTTVLDPAQNYTLKRDAKFGAVGARYKSDGTIRNGIFAASAGENAFTDVVFTDGTDTSSALPLAVACAMQIMAYHNKANSVLTGSFKMEGGGNPTLGEIWSYGGRKFLLQGGTWDILSGIINGAVLREFDLFADVFPAISVSYTAKDGPVNYGEQSVRNSIAAAGGNSSSGGGGGGAGTVTSVGMSSSADGISVTGGPITTAGTFVIHLDNGRQIPTAQQVAMGEIAYGWGNHASQGYATQAWVLQQIATISGSMQAAPRLIIRRDLGGHLQQRIEIYHPMLGISLSSGNPYEAVLMVAHSRNTRKRVLDQTYRMLKKGYAVAMGNHQITDAAGQTIAFASSSASSTDPKFVTFSFDSLRDFIIKRFAYDNRYTRSQMFGRSYSDWSADSSYTDRGFSGKSGYLQMGIAVRVMNPLFLQYATNPEDPTNTEIKVNGVRVRRWIYSDVAPLGVVLMSDDGTRNRRQMFFNVADV